MNNFDNNSQFLNANREVVPGGQEGSMLQFDSGAAGQRAQSSDGLRIGKRFQNPHRRDISNLNNQAGAGALSQTFFMKPPTGLRPSKGYNQRLYSSKYGQSYMNNKVYQLNYTAAMSGRNMPSHGSHADRIVYRNKALGRSMNNGNFVLSQGGSLSQKFSPTRYGVPMSQAQAGSRVHSSKDLSRLMSADPQMQRMFPTLN